MPFVKPTLQQLVDRAVSDIESRVLDGDTLLRRSPLQITGRVNAGMSHLQYGYLDYLSEQLFILTAEGTFLEIGGTEYGVIRKAATYSSGEVSATGTSGIIIPAGAIVESPDGKTYSVDSTITIVGGSADLSITALDAGSAGNQSAGTILTFITPISGVTSTVTVDSNGLTGGVDEEDDEDYRARILSRKRLPPHGGAEFDYENWALEVSGVTRAWAFPQYNGPGTIGLAFVRDNDSDSIIPTDAQMEEVSEYIMEHTNPLTGKDEGLPVGAQNGFFMVTLSLYNLDFDIDIVPNTTAVQENIEDRLNDLIVTQGGPGETIYLTEITQAIGGAAGLTTYRLNSPIADVGIPTNRVPYLGTLTWGGY